jgi:hypothetical protein
MSRIIIFGVTNLDFEGLEDPSIKVYLVGTEYDYEDENIISVPDKNILDFYESEDLENVDEQVIFIDCTGASKNYLDVMYRLQTSRFNKRCYLVGPNHKDEITLKVNDITFQEHFNPFDGDEMPKNYKEKKYLLSFFETLSKVVYYYIRAGFDKKEINEIPPGWSMNLAGKELNSVIRYYGLFPIAPDVNITIEVLQNSQYRQIILSTLISIVSNFVVRNKVVNIAEIEDWNSTDTWMLIQTRF